MVRMLLFGVTVCLLLGIVTSTSASTRSRRHAVPCPVECNCTHNRTSGITTLHCTSLNFVNKLTPKENALIISLDLSNNGLTVLEKRLKKLHNLEWLNLSHNKISDLKHFPHLPKLTHLNLRSNVIKSFSGKSLPHTIVALDVSHNYLRQLPRDLLQLDLLKRVDVFGNPFSCAADSLDTRDLLLEREVKLVGNVICHEPAKFKGQSWLHVVDFDEFFKLHEQDDMQADQGSGDGDELGSGTSPIDVTTIPSESTTSDFVFDTENASGDGEIIIQKTKYVETMATIPPVVAEVDEVETANSHTGANIFIIVVAVLIIAIVVCLVQRRKKKNRETRRRNRDEADKKRAAAVELKPMQQQRKPSDKQNGNSESVPLMNGQNGNSKAAEANGTPHDDVEAGLPEPERPNSANLEVKSVKVRASEIPDSVPHTPILVTRSRTPDGKQIVVTPRLNQRPTSN